jgi:hypothetical protein
MIPSQIQFKKETKKLFADDKYSLLEVLTENYQEGKKGEFKYAYKPVGFNRGCKRELVECTGCNLKIKVCKVQATEENGIIQ